MRGFRTAAVAALAVVVLLAALPSGAEARGRGRPLLLTIEGFVDHAPAGATTDEDVKLRCGKQVRPFAVRKITVTPPLVTQADVLRAVRPYQQAFILRGKDDVLRHFTRAAASDGLAISGFWRAGQFDLMVDRIEPLEAEKK